MQVQNIVRCKDLSHQTADPHRLFAQQMHQINLLEFHNQNNHIFHNLCLILKRHKPQTLFTKILHNKCSVRFVLTHHLPTLLTKHQLSQNVTNQVVSTKNTFQREGIKSNNMKIIQ